MTTESMITTYDNPFDPFTQYQEWYAFDVRMGYNTLGLMARLINLSPDLPDNINDEEIEQVIDEMIKENVTGMFKKVTREI